MEGTKKTSKLDTAIKVGTFVLTVVGAITAFITWQHGFHKPDKPDPLTAERKQQYINVSNLVGQMENAPSLNQLKTLSPKFDSLYNGEMKFYEDTTISLAMRRFKLELEDKLSGRENVLQPFKFQQTGDAVIEACKNQIYKLN